ncbi:hypothetical protein EHEL_010140 [Encephalitozoon hellem ATCC 50504]|uniref:DNA/RNA-binding protein KIN17 n=1 Tax=Encephalitozoon hellem TaxID=27973 RepID=A0A9Q9C8K0_ENCHE|nr:uncharacterized protein EHEL_010140 [Encephalitozoon hellem ATCC 50504]AFM97639.1 hypothetical protein EHEL_010140 [Encephalitozoon hellem ATCC 50504]UTX42328.1 DNA/RNA-binding protein KIN17 [Encephalitozoon hellem]WEL37770.1 DNA/RNA-binding protein KIN17 [Encephalitozoon hellem]|eukprot:XP_003886620.1 hypothetical protein EHEL_010140 [Encephalitozoon hellem ATCC 50504]
MFCIPCQKKFSTKNAYKCHTSTSSHVKAEDEYRTNRKAAMERNTANFLADFHSYISQIAEYKEIGQAYREYLAKNRFRIEGTNFKSVEEAVDKIAKRVSVLKEGGKVMVKRLSKFKLVRKPPVLDLEKLRSTFKIRMIKGDNDVQRKAKEDKNKNCV